MWGRKEKEEAIIIINSDFQSQIQFSDNQNIINFLICSKANNNNWMGKMRRK